MSLNLIREILVDKTGFSAKWKVKNKFSGNDISVST